MVTNTDNRSPQITCTFLSWRRRTILRLIVLRICFWWNFCFNNTYQCFYGPTDIHSVDLIEDQTIWFTKFGFCISTKLEIYRGGFHGALNAIFQYSSRSFIRRVDFYWTVTSMSLENKNQKKEKGASTNKKVSTRCRKKKIILNTLWRSIGCQKRRLYLPPRCGPMWSYLVDKVYKIAKGDEWEETEGEKCLAKKFWKS